MNTNKKVCVGCLELIDPDNLVSMEKSIYWHSSCLDSFQQTPKAPQKYLQMQPEQWYSWNPNNSSTPSYPVNIFDIVSNGKSNTNAKDKHLGKYYIYDELKALITKEYLFENNQVLQEETLEEKEKAWKEVFTYLEETDEKQLGEESWENMKKSQEKKPVELKNDIEAIEEFSKLQKELAEPEMMPKKKKLTKKS
jgi:hypothetical protein